MDTALNRARNAVKNAFDRQRHASSDLSASDEAGDQIDARIIYSNLSDEDTAALDILFNSDEYLLLNPDVAAASVDPLEHFLGYGSAEGRPHGKAPTTKDPLILPDLNPTLASTRSLIIEKLVELGRIKEAFDLSAGHTLHPRAFFALSNGLIIVGRHDDAITLANQAIENRAALNTIFFETSVIIADLLTIYIAKGMNSPIEDLLALLPRDNRSALNPQILRGLSKSPINLGLLGADFATTKKIFESSLRKGSAAAAFQTSCRLLLINPDPTNLNWIQEQIRATFMNVEELLRSKEEFRLLLQVLALDPARGSEKNKIVSDLTEICIFSSHHSSLEDAKSILTFATEVCSELVIPMSAINLSFDLALWIASGHYASYEEVSPRLTNILFARNSDITVYSVELLSARLQETAYNHSQSGYFADAVRFYSSSVAFGVNHLNDIHQVIRNNLYACGRRVGHEIDFDSFWDLIQKNEGAFDGRAARIEVRTATHHSQSFNIFYNEVFTARDGSMPELEIYPHTNALTSIPGDLNFPPLYVARLDNVLSAANINGYLTNGILIYDKLCVEHAQKAWLGDMITSVVAEKHPTPFILAHNTRHAIVLLPSHISSSIRAGIALFGVQARNYGHWFLEYLPRVLAFEKAGISSEVPYIINKSLPESCLRALILLNKSNRPILEIEDHSNISFDVLYVSAPPAYFPLDVKQGESAFDTVWPHDVLRELRKAIIDSIKASGTSGKEGLFIYISGKNQNARRLTNEHIVEDYLVSRGFKSVCPETMAFDEQVELFAKARVIVGVTKSAFANTLFCNPSCLVVGLTNDTADFNYRGYASWTQASGARIVFLRGSPEASSSHRFHKDFAVDINKLGSILDDHFEAEIQSKLNDIEEEHIIRTLLRYAKISNTNDVDEEYIRSSLKHGIYSLSAAVEIFAHQVPLFDSDFYKYKYLMNMRSGISPLIHYLIVGRYEGYMCSHLFDTSYYLKSNPDVKIADVDPLLHYLELGMLEGRIGVDIGDVHLSAGSADWQMKCYENYHGINLINTLACYQGAGRSIKIKLYRGKNYPGAYQTNIWSVYFLEQEGRLDEAIETCSLLLEVFQEFWFIHDYYGVLQRRVGNLAIAAASFQRASSLAPDNEQVRARANEMAGYVNPGDINRSLAMLDDKLYKRPLNEAVLLFDTSFPDTISSFRFGEFDAYVKSMPVAIVRSSNWDVRAYGGHSEFQDIIDRYCSDAQVSSERILPFGSEDCVHAKSGYTIFLNNAVLLSSKEHFDIDRMGFTLYPGGGFDFGNRSSSRKLERILKDNRLKYIITTQNITYKYLRDMYGVASDKLVHVFGGVVPVFLKTSAEVDRTRENKSVLDVCFVAQKYSQFGVEKGYDVFASVVRFLGQDIRFRFHVVGGFSENTIDLNGATNVKFYGSMPQEFFPSFYQKMDVFLSPNISGYELNGAGSFDGFPTTAAVEASAQGVTLFLTDSLNLNQDLLGNSYLQDNRDFVKIHRSSDELCEKLLFYFENQCLLREIGSNGRKKLAELYSYEAQILPRISALRRFLMN